MPYPLLPNLFCSPQDVIDRIGIDALQLREDDNNLASGQAVTTTAAATAPATSLTVSALQYGLLAGTTLIFSNAGLALPVTVVLSAVANVSATTLTVFATTDDIPSGATATDNGVNVWLATMALQACQRATQRVKLWCLNRYQDSDLYANAQSRGSVNAWATAIACRWMGMRRFNSSPAGVDDEYAEALGEMKMVQAGQLQIECIGTRSAAAPFLDNITGADWLTYTKARVESITSDAVPTVQPQFVDWGSVYSLETLY